jgi:hypothetical protein
MRSNTNITEGESMLPYVSKTAHESAACSLVTPSNGIIAVIKYECINIHKSEKKQYEYKK